MDETMKKRTFYDDDDIDIKISSGIALDRSVQQSIADAKLRYTRPDYNPQTRKVFYDDGNAHKAAIDKAFSESQTVRDPYTGTKLVAKQRDAKTQYGTKWQDHAAEADHIDPLSRFFQRTQKNPFLTTEDVKEIGNCEDNYQVLSRSLNQTNKTSGKGGSTQQEWASDPTRMEGISEKIESGESIDSVRSRISYTGSAAERRNDARAKSRAIQNAARTGHEAGLAGAKSAGGTAVIVSALTNIVAVLNHEKDWDEAIADIARDGGTAAVNGYVTGEVLTVAAQLLSNVSSEMVQTLLASNVPGKIITAVTVTGNSIQKWCKGEITTGECIHQIGEKGVNMATMGYSMFIGQTLIPIPVIGAAIGGFVGSIVTNSLIHELVSSSEQKKIADYERRLIIEQCDYLAEQERKYREEVEIYAAQYFKRCYECFNTSLTEIEQGFLDGDADKVCLAADRITTFFGGEVSYKTQDEFNQFLLSDEPFEF